MKTELKRTAIGLLFAGAVIWGYFYVALPAQIKALNSPPAVQTAPVLTVPAPDPRLPAPVIMDGHRNR